MCERQVDRPTLGANDDVVRVIKGHDINVWFEPVGGFVLPICGEFYQKLRVMDENLCLLKTNVREKVMEVTPGVIAESLHYEIPPPNTRVYPYNTHGRKSLQEYASLIYEDPA